jgi:hypothetical protein
MVLWFGTVEKADHVTMSRFLVVFNVSNANPQSARQRLLRLSAVNRAPPSVVPDKQTLFPPANTVVVWLSDLNTHDMTLSYTRKQCPSGAYTYTYWRDRPARIVEARGSST